MKKIFALMITCVITAVSSNCVFADKLEEKLLPVQGIVSEVTPFVNPDGSTSEESYFITLEKTSDEGEGIVVFWVSEETEIKNELNVAVGAEVRAYYDSSLPVILIYPPRYNAVSLEVINEARPDPADAEPPAESGVEEANDPSKILVIVNGTALSGVFAIDDESEAIMAPLRPIAEALGYDVSWDAERKQVGVGNSISLTIGKDYYVYARTSPITLGIAPVVIEGATYVPLSFFDKVMRLDSGHTHGESVTIDNR